MTDTDIFIIGAGVVGLACARAFAAHGRRVIIVDKEKSHGAHTSSRNTGVIHAGVYYEPGTLKAKLCFKGRNQLYAYCQARGIAHERIGKLFIATVDAALPGLQKLYDRAIANGVDDLRIVDAAAIHAMEPGLVSLGGVICPQSGIIDTHEYMLALLGEAESDGAIFVPNTLVGGASFDGTDWQVDIGNGDTVSARCVVNAAGLAGLNLAKSVFPGRAVPDAAPLKGAYLKLSGRSPLRHAIYPDLNPGVVLPRVDATPGLDGVLRFGPATHEAVSYDDYLPPQALIEELLPRIQAYMPQVRAEDLSYDYVGVRPRVKPDGNGPADFIFSSAPLPGWMDLWNIESPGLTSSLAIADHVIEEVSSGADASRWL